MKNYGVQMHYRSIDDTVTLFTSRKKAELFLNEQRAKHEDRKFVLKEFSFYKGKAFERTIELPF